MIIGYLSCAPGTEATRLWSATGTASLRSGGTGSFRILAPSLGPTAPQSADRPRGCDRRHAPVVDDVLRLPRDRKSIATS